MTCKRQAGSVKDGTSGARENTGPADDIMRTCSGTAVVLCHAGFCCSACRMHRPSGHAKDVCKSAVGDTSRTSFIIGCIYVKAPQEAQIDPRGPCIRPLSDTLWAYRAASAECLITYMFLTDSANSGHAYSGVLRASACGIGFCRSPAASGSARLSGADPCWLQAFFPAASPALLILAPAKAQTTGLTRAHRLF